MPLSNFSILHLGYCRASRMTAVPLAFFSIVRLGYFALFCVCFENTEACIIILPGVLRKPSRVGYAWLLCTTWLNQEWQLHDVHLEPGLAVVESHDGHQVLRGVLYW